jgi:hypothetical protein
MAQWIDDDDDDRGPAAHVPGAYQHHRDAAQRDHDTPDPRESLNARHEERAELEAAALWRKPSARHAALLAGEPITVRKYTVHRCNWNPRPGLGQEWLDDPDITFVTVDSDDWVTPGDRLDYLAPGPAPDSLHIGSSGSHQQ